MTAPADTATEERVESMRAEWAEQDRRVAERIDQLADQAGQAATVADLRAVLAGLLDLIRQEITS